MYFVFDSSSLRSLRKALRASRRYIKNENRYSTWATVVTVRAFEDSKNWPNMDADLSALSPELRQYVGDRMQAEKLRRRTEAQIQAAINEHVWKFEHEQRPPLGEEGS